MVPLVMGFSTNIMKNTLIISFEWKFASVEYYIRQNNLLVWSKFWLGFFFDKQSWRGCFTYTANVCRELQELYREIGVQGFQIYGDCMYTRNPCNFEIPHSYFHCNICREFDFTGILQGFPTLDVGKPCNNLYFLNYPCKICRKNL